MRGAVAMTNEQKEIIRNMRKQNETYAAISDAVGMFLSIKIVTISPKKIKPYVSAKG